MMKQIKNVILAGYSRFLCGILKLRGVEVGLGAIVLGLPRIKKHPGSNISLGNDAMLFSVAFANPLGPTERSFLHTITAESRIDIGDGSGVSSSTIVARQLVRIGNRTFIGANCLICDNDFHSLDHRQRNTPSDAPSSAPVILGEDVFVGTRSVILKGVEIGDRSVIGAGSVVTKSIPPDSLAAGNPAKIIRSLTQ